MIFEKKKIFYRVMLLRFFMYIDFEHTLDFEDYNYIPFSPIYIQVNHFQTYTMTRLIHTHNTANVSKFPCRGMRASDVNNTDLGLSKKDSIFTHLYSSNHFQAYSTN